MSPITAGNGVKGGRALKPCREVIDSTHQLMEACYESSRLSRVGVVSRLANERSSRGDGLRDRRRIHQGTHTGENGEPREGRLQARHMVSMTV